MPKWTCIGHNLPLVVLVLMTIYTLSLNRLIQNKTVRAKMKTCIFFNSFFFFLLLQKNPLLHMYLFLSVCVLCDANKKHKWNISSCHVIEICKNFNTSKTRQKSKFTCKMTRAFSIERSSEGKPSLFQTNSSLSVHRNRRKSNSDKWKRNHSHSA